MKTSKIIITLSLLFLFIPHITLAGTLAVGVECLSNHDSDCVSGDCEEANTGKWYCDCDDDIDCNIFKNGTEKWTCKDGASATNNLDYCLKDGATTADDIKTPLPITETSWLGAQIDTLFDSDVMNQATINEINKILKEPRLSIRIPGLSFTTKEDVAKLTKEEAGGTYMYIPYLGEYLAATYRYGVIAGAIIAIVMIINAGFNWAISGGSAEKIKYAQTFFNKR